MPRSFQASRAYRDAKLPVLVVVVLLLRVVVLVDETEVVPRKGLAEPDQLPAEPSSLRLLLVLVVLLLVLVLRSEV